MQIIDYDDRGRILAITHGSGGFIHPNTPGALAETVYRNEAPEIETDKIQGSSNRFYVEPKQVQGKTVLLVHEKTIVYLTTNKSEIAANGEDAATITVDSEDAVILHINGDPEKQQVYDEGIEVSTEEPKLYRFQVMDDRHWSEPLDILAKWVIPNDEDQTSS